MKDIQVELELEAGTFFVWMKLPSLLVKVGSNFLTRKKKVMKPKQRVRGTPLWRHPITSAAEHCNEYIKTLLYIFYIFNQVSIRHYSWKCIHACENDQQANTNTTYAIKYYMCITSFLIL